MQSASTFERKKEKRRKKRKAPVGLLPSSTAVGSYLDQPRVRAVGSVDLWDCIGRYGASLLSGNNSTT